MRGGGNENVLGMMAKKIAKTATTAEEVQTAVDGVTIQQALESYGDARATEAANIVQKKLEEQQKKDKEKDPAKEDEGKGKQKETTNEDMPAWARLMLTKVNDLGDTVAAMRGKALTDSRRRQLEEVISPLTELQRKRNNCHPTQL